MGLKKIFGIGMGCLLMASVAFAQEVTVDGVGIDKDSAVRDAMRNAVENVIGTYIDSRTLVDKSVVALDEIYAKSQGFVKNIRILKESKSNKNYRVTARINVDTNPNAQLMNRLNMILLLNDPRISIIIDYHENYSYNDQKGKYPQICEGTINNKLVELGFSHILDSSAVRDDYGGVNLNNDVTDYMIFGKLDIDTNQVVLPSYSSYTQEGAYIPDVETGLVKAQAELDIKVMKTDTREIIGEYRVEGQAMKDTINNSENQVVKNIAINAAEKLRSIFARKAANSLQGMQVIVRTDDYNNVLRFDKELRSITGVKSTDIRSFENGKAIIEVDSNMKPHQIFRLLKEKNKLNLFMEKTSANSVEITMS